VFVFSGFLWLAQVVEIGQCLLAQPSVIPDGKNASWTAKISAEQELGIHV
jgi:hypothetical protein